MFNLKNYLYCLILDPKGANYKGHRRILCFPFGLLTGYLFYFAFIKRLNFPVELEESLLPVVLLLYTISYCLSIQFRTITWLMIPTLAGQIGRSYLYLLFFNGAIQYPTTNLIENTFESSRVFVCTIMFHKNVTEQKFRFIFEPYIGFFKGIHSASKKIAEKPNFLNQIDQELESDNITRSKKEMEQKIIQSDKEIGGKNQM